MGFGSRFCAIVFVVLCCTMFASSWGAWPPLAPKSTLDLTPRNHTQFGRFRSNDVGVNKGSHKNF